MSLLLIYIGLMMVRYSPRSDIARYKSLKTNNKGSITIDGLHLAKKS